MYAIVTDALGYRMYLAWQPGTWDDGYFWTSKETFDECLFDEGWNTREHRFAFRSHGQAMDAMLKLNLPESWESHVVEFQEICDRVSYSFIILERRNIYVI